MKSRPYISSLLVVAIAALLSACSATTSNDKKARLEDLKAQQAKIAGEIKKLEEEYNKENPASAPVALKEVNVQELSERTFNYFVQTQGAVEAVDNILVSSRTAGITSPWQTGPPMCGQLFS